MDEQEILRKLSARLYTSIAEVRALFAEGKRDRRLEQILALLWALEEDIDRAAAARAA